MSINRFCVPFIKCHINNNLLSKLEYFMKNCPTVWSYLGYCPPAAGTEPMESRKALAHRQCHSLQSNGSRLYDTMRVRTSGYRWGACDATNSDVTVEYLQASSLLPASTRNSTRCLWTETQRHEVICKCQCLRKNYIMGGWRERTG